VPERTQKVGCGEGNGAKTRITRPKAAQWQRLPGVNLQKPDGITRNEL
jgi:hypothetical protein